MPFKLLRPMLSFTQVSGNTLDVVDAGLNRIGTVESIRPQTRKTRTFPQIFPNTIPLLEVPRSLVSASQVK
jgi:hypothetical protein